MDGRRQWDCPRDSHRSMDFGWSRDRRRWDLRVPTAAKLLVDLGALMSRKMKHTRPRRRSLRAVGPFPGGGEPTLIGLVVSRVPQTPAKRAQSGPSTETRDEAARSRVIASDVLIDGGSRINRRATARSIPGWLSCGSQKLDSTGPFRDRDCTPD